MARSVTALELQLRRELNHHAWLCKHLPNSAQLALSQRRISNIQHQLAKQLARSLRVQLIR